MRRLTIGSILPILCLACLAIGCAKRMPEVDLKGLDPSYLEACSQGSGLLVVLDERKESMWGGGYDQSKWLLLGEERGEDSGRAPTTTMVIRRRVMKRRPINIVPTGTIPLADWHCEHSWPRVTTFRVATLKAGDLIELITPLVGPEMLEWHFASSQHCVIRSRAQLGHEDDTYRLALDAQVVDGTGGVKLLSQPEAYPMILEHATPLPPLPVDRQPRLRYSQRCNGWSHLRGRTFNTVLWLVRHGDIEGIHPALLGPVKPEAFIRRAQAAADWVQRHVELEVWAGSDWMRWMPRLAPATVLKRKSADAGSAAVLLFRILEDSGLQPRFALLHTDVNRPFRINQPDLAQFDRMAVLFDDNTGKTHWLLPGLPYDQEIQPPEILIGRQALVLERYWIDRHQGSGRCKPEIEIPWSCQIATPEPIEMRLIKIGDKPSQTKK
ncbi:MAG: hypothetical protein JRF33_14765 [Deltaproteobacteria bacterium]|nr:hypothetical protein [Deltaproteobacteria bacterium]